MCGVVLNTSGRRLYIFTRLYPLNEQCKHLSMRYSQKVAKTVLCNEMSREGRRRGRRKERRVLRDEMGKRAMMRAGSGMAVWRFIYSHGYIR